jgi:hypothetical protein
VPEALAATNVAPPPQSALARSTAPVGSSPDAGISTDTGAATPFLLVSPPGQAVSAPPFEPAPLAHDRVRPETPIATVQDREPAPGASEATSAQGARQKNDRRVVILGVVATVAVGVAIFSLTRTPRVTAPIATTPTASLAVPASVAVPASAAVPPALPSTLPSAASSPVATATAAPPTAVASSSAHAAASPAASSATSPKPRAPLPGGFSDPTDRNGPVTWKVQDRHVRLFVRLASNESNVADAVVRKAIEWSSWEYLRCYERVFGGAKDLPEGTLSVGFDILDQLPRHAKLVSSTFESATFNDCVVRTLVGQTINAAGPDGKGHAVEGFRFVPN